MNDNLFSINNAGLTDPTIPNNNKEIGTKETSPIDKKTQTTAQGQLSITHQPTQQITWKSNDSPKSAELKEEISTLKKTLAAITPQTTSTEKHIASLDTLLELLNKRSPSLKTIQIGLNEIKVKVDEYASKELSAIENSNTQTKQVSYLSNLSNKLKSMAEKISSGLQPKFNQVKLNVALKFEDLKVQANESKQSLLSIVNKTIRKIDPTSEHESTRKVKDFFKNLKIFSPNQAAIKVLNDNKKLADENKTLKAAYENIKSAVPLKLKSLKESAGEKLELIKILAQEKIESLKTTILSKIGKTKE